MKHIRKNWRRFAAVLLSAALMISTVSQTAFAAGADTGKAIQFVDGGTAAKISGGAARAERLTAAGRPAAFISEPIRRTAPEAADIIPTLMKAAMYIPTASAAGMEMSTGTNMTLLAQSGQNGHLPIPCLILLAAII